MKNSQAQKQNIYSEITAPFVAYVVTSPNLMDIFAEDSKLLSFCRLKFSILASMLLEYDIKFCRPTIREVAKVFHEKRLSSDEFIEILMIFLFIMNCSKHTSKGRKRATGWSIKANQFFSLAILEYQKRNFSGMEMLIDTVAELFFVESSGSRQKKTPLEDDKQAKITKDIIDRCHVPHDEQKIDAATFLTKNSVDIALLDELSEHEKSIQGAFALHQSFSSELVNLSYVFFKEYTKVLKQFKEFCDLEYAIGSLSSIFYEFEPSKLKEEKSLKLFYLLTQGVSNDLANWRKVVFETKETRDIHFLDASLLSSIAQMESMLYGSGVILQESEDDGFELF